MEEIRLHPGITARLYTDRKCFGPGVAMLLRRVERLHSLRAAAQDMEMAYSKAWTILREAERGLGLKLVESTTGGRNGGGASLTAAGRRVLDAYEGFERDLKACGEELFTRYFGELLREYRQGGASEAAPMGESGETGK